jgi:hypothetical protein
MALCALGCGANSPDDIEKVYRDDCYCSITVQKEVDCGSGDVGVEYSQPWPTEKVPVAQCAEDWGIEDAFEDEAGCLVSYFGNGECLNL